MNDILKNKELKDRELKARKAIILSLYDKDDPYFGGAELFVAHHLEVIEPEYWLKHTGESNPSPEKVLSLLVLKHIWSEDNYFDFTLPEETTDNVICVKFSENSEICEISMEN